MLKNRSIAFKQSFFVLLPVIIIILVIFAFTAWQVWQIMSRNVETATINLAMATANKLDQSFIEAQRAVKHLALTIEEMDMTEEQMNQLLRNTVVTLKQELPEVYGGCVAFKPYSYRKDSKYYMSYACFKNGKLQMMRLGSKEYDYFYYNWFTLPEHLGKPLWTEPYFDDGAGDVLMTTYSVPIYRKKGEKKEFWGVVTIDFSLSKLRRLVDSVRLFDSGYSFLISKFGRFVSHPDPKLIMNYTIFSLARESKAPELRKIGRDMIAGKSGFVPYENSVIYEKSSWLCYMPLRANGWVLAIVFPHEILFATLKQLQLKTAGIAVAGAMLVLLVVIFISGKLSRPLRELTSAAAKIGRGNFHSELPQVSSGDEIGKLNNAFSQMQSELHRHIEELKITTAAKERIESELNIARQIQEGILPQILPPFPECDEFSLYAELKSARAVGGDLYDFFMLDDDHLCFVIGDVSGKGIPASLFMAVTQTLQRSVAVSGMSSGEILSKVSCSLAKNNETLMFVTSYLCVLNVRTGEMQFTNAGHNPPYLLRCDGTIEKMEKLHGPPIAISEVEYGSDIITLKPGDCLLLYTDGVTEAMDPDNQEFGDERLRKFLENTPHSDLKALIGRLMQEVKKFADGEEQSDDITALAVRFGLPTEQQEHGNDSA